MTRLLQVALASCAFVVSVVGFGAVCAQLYAEGSATQPSSVTSSQTPAKGLAADLNDFAELPDEVYSYDPDGRRDPFVSLLGRGTNIGPINARPPGLAGLSVNELSLQGLVLSEGRYLAVMQNPDRRTYILRGEEQLFDALVKSISAEGVTFLQEVNDPLSLVKEREVLRRLQGREEGR